MLTVEIKMITSSLRYNPIGSSPDHTFKKLLNLKQVNFYKKKLIFSSLLLNKVNNHVTKTETKQLKLVIY